MRRNNIIHFIHFYSKPGGIEVLLPVIINALPGWNFKVFVIRKPDPADPNIYESLNIPVEHASNKNTVAIFKVFNYAFKNRNEIFHAFNIGPVFLFVLRLAGVKRLIYSIHGTKYWETNFKKMFFKLFWKLALCKRYKITSNTEYSKNVFLEKVSKKSHIQVLYNPVNGTKFIPLLNTHKSGIFKIFYAGRLGKGKNLELWIDTAYSLHKTLPSVYFEIYGSGPLAKSLSARIEKLNATDYITLKGFRQDIENVYRKDDLLLFMSDYESFGNVVVECILCGTPVIVSEIPSMREIFKDFPEFIIRKDDNLKDNLLHKIAEIHKLKELTLKARDQFLIRFSVEAHTSSLNRIYNSFNECRY